MADNNSNLNNVKIVSSGSIPAGQNSFTEYQHDLFDFSSAEVICMDFNDLTKSKALDLMKKRSNLIVIDTIKANDLTDGKVCGNNAIQLYTGMPCMIKTNTGSLIPQMIVPSVDSGMGDNGLLDNSMENAQIGDDDYQVVWTPDFKYLKKQLSSNADEDTKKDAENIQSFGKRRTDGSSQGYITMESCLKKNLDSQGFLTRKFKANLNKIKGGSFCFGYQFLCDKDMNDAELTVAPKININFGDEDDDKYQFSISIPPNNDIHVRMKEDAESGTLNTGTSKLKPPHCINNEKWNLLFCFPIHAGLVLSGNATKSIKDITEGIFVQLSEQKAPLNCVAISNGSGRYYAGDNFIQQDIRKFPESAIRWLPAAIHKNNNACIVIPFPSDNDDGEDKNTDVKAVPNFTDTFEIEWVKSFGKFFYCPVYFFNKCRFKLYFKGDLMTVGDTGDNVDITRTYYYLPIGKVNLTTEHEDGDDWKGVNSDGSFKKLSGENIGNIEDDDGEEKETVYCCEFNFSSNKLRRSPIELFGVAAWNKYNGERYSGINRSNGTYSFTETKNSVFQNLTVEGANSIFPYIQNVSVSTGLGGISGSIEYDRYPLQNMPLIIPQSIGQLCFDITKGSTTSQTTFGTFRGFAIENRNNYSENNHTGTLNLLGVQKKLEDMKLICVPFWDGDELVTICKYLESYANIQLKMVNTKGTMESALRVSSSWTSTARSGKSDNNSLFRVPRSTDWQRPSIDFRTGTSVLQALNHLAEVCGCVFVVQPDGCGYFLELDGTTGIPGCVANQTAKTINESDIISINLSPYMENKYNTFMTMGFLSKINASTGKMSVQDVAPSIMYTPYENIGTNFPWSRIMARVENGWMTEADLAEVHGNTMKAGRANIWQGNVTVAGNNNITYLYQKVKIGTTTFFVSSIDHNVNLQTKEWTTSYGLSYYQEV